MAQAYQGLVDTESLAQELTACSADHILRDIQSSSSLVLIARSQEGALEGTGSLREEENLRGRLFGGFVSTPGRGLGLAMGTKLIEAARSFGLAEVFSAVYDGNAAGARTAESLGLQYHGISRPGIYMPNYTVKEYSLEL